MPNADGGETREEYEERLRVVRATQIFGDTPTDPTIGDVVVPAHDEEGANAAAAEVASQVEDGDEEAADLSPEEAKRQLEPLDAEEVDEGAEEEGGVQDDQDGGADAADTGITAGDQDTAPDSTDASGDEEDEDSDRPNVKETVAQIESASSVEEVDSIVEGDERVTVQRAADKKRSELSS